MTFKRIWHAEEVLAALETGASVVTASERLARAVRLAYAEARVADGAEVWERPRINSYSSFLERLFDAAVGVALSASRLSLPQRLSPAAAEAVWEAIIRASPLGGVLLQPAATARAAYQAWNQCAAYYIPLERVNQTDDEDARQWSAWAGRFTALCREQNWLEDARLADWLTVHLREGTLPAPASVVFAGFDDMTPQQELLVMTLRSHGAKVQVLEAPLVELPAALRVILADPEAELRAAAQWTRALLERDAGARIAIVVRDLAADRSLLSRALDDALCPGAALDPSGVRPYNLSLGLPLASYPVVHAALSVLELLHGRLAFATASLLLRTPFLTAAGEERDARARLEIRLRGRVSAEITPKALSDFAAGTGVHQLVRALQAITEQRQALPTRQKPSAWAAAFALILNLAGWPGPRPLDSAEYQTVTRFRELLGALAELDTALGPIALDDALSRLKRLANDVIFQPEAADSPVQVMGLLETAGLSFEKLWIAGLSDDVWPESPRPQPFIPAKLQREYRVPHAGAGLELEFANRLTKRLLASAAEAVVSTPARQADAELRPSPLIAHLSLLPSTELPQAGVVSYRVQLQRGQAAAVEDFTDARGPALDAAAEVRGGTRLLKSQAACPFQAFAWHRLGAAPLDEPGFGPNAAERGRLVHVLLERVWEQLRDQAALLALDTAERRALVERTAAAVLAQRARDLPDVYTPKLVALERERLTGLVSEWLEQETLRQPFRVVEREQRHSVRLGRLAFNIRTDRIDELADGGRVIIDYKTGRADLKDWLEVRPEEPQLPLYAVHNRGRLTGLAFASIKPGEMRFAGLADRAGIALGVQEYAVYRQRPEGADDWGQLLDFWEQGLGALASEYTQGEARVAPKSLQTCRHCHLAILCRIHELTGMAAEEEVDDAD